MLAISPSPDQVTRSTPVVKYEKVTVQKPYKQYVTDMVAEDFQVNRYEMREQVGNV